MMAALAFTPGVAWMGLLALWVGVVVVAWLLMDGEP